jgi:threonine/homoserine/homoserine lactone efflux protein
MRTDILGAIAVIAIVVITPGPDTAITVQSALGARRAGLGAAVGVTVGQAIWTVAASAGLAALVVASEPIFIALKWLGAGYLIFLGCRSFLAAILRGGSHRVQDSQLNGRRQLPTAAAFRRGLLSNLANPKMAVFFTSLLPQFGSASFSTMLVYGGVLCGLTLIWLSGYATVVARIGDVLRGPSVRRCLDAIAGLALASLGIWRLVAD